MTDAIRFESKEGAAFDFRTGAFLVRGASVPTPLFFPIINIITGPPGVLANGGIWRHIKAALFKDEPVKAFMTHILHFTDYHVDLKMLDRWLETPIPQRIKEETGQRPLVFVDSGGYRLLYNTGLDIERYGFKARVKDIMTLQSRFGGDMVATLDYPIPPRLNDIEAETRIKQSVDNCVETARMSRKLLGDGFLIQMAVHGRNRSEARQTVVTLLSRLQKARLTEVPIGLAIGSLVPLASSPEVVIDIVRGVSEGLRACDWVDASVVPVHAFGVSSRMIPLLAALGVDSFDGTTYVQNAQSLRYVLPGSLSPRPFADLERIECRCHYCRILEKGGLDEAKQILRGPSFGRIEFGGRETNKSYIYALLALHNLGASLEISEKARKAATSDQALEELLVGYAKDMRARRALAHLLQYFPDAGEFLWKVGIARLEKAPRTARANQRLLNEGTSEMKSPQTAKSPAKNEPEVSLKFGPDDFDVTKMDYRLPSTLVLLLLPCSQQKPYSSSPTHRFVRRALDAARIPVDGYSVVTISGNYGPVPHEFELDPRVQSYDFFLSGGDEKRIGLLAARTRKFVQDQRGTYRWIVAYSTARSYREVTERALRGVPDTFILPENLRARRGSEFRKPQNIRQLVERMRKLTPPQKEGARN